MGVTAIALAGTALADPAYEPDGYVLQAVTVGSTHQLASGAMVYDYVTTRYRFSLRWKAITEAEKALIRTAVETQATETFTAPDGYSHTVRVVPNSWRESYIEGGDAVRYYNCEVQLEESD